MKKAIAQITKLIGKIPKNIYKKNACKFKNNPSIAFLSRTSWDRLYSGRGSSTYCREQRRPRRAMACPRGSCWGTCSQDLQLPTGKRYQGGRVWMSKSINVNSNEKWMLANEFPLFFYLQSRPQPFSWWILQRNTAMKQRNKLVRFLP